MPDPRVVWYSYPPVQFEIVKALRFKELQIIGEGLSVRWLNCQHVGILRSIRAHLHTDERAASWYRSLDNYSKIPLMSFNMHIRGKEYCDWAEIRSKYVRGQDFGLDLDCKAGTWKDAVPDAKRIRELFDRFGVRYAHWMSGSHGFHFVVPYEDLPPEMQALEYDELLAVYRAMATKLAEKCPSIDLGIYMPTRVLKCPYTLDKHGRVIWPLDAKDWELLSTGRGDWLLDPLAVIQVRGASIVARGIYLQGKHDGFTKLIDQWGGWEA